MTEKKATLKVDGKDLDLPIYSPTLGRDVIDVSKLVANGVFTFDPGFTSTASCESKITFIDGEVGSCCIAATPSRNWPASPTTWKCATPCSTASCRQQSRKSNSSAP